MLDKMLAEIKLQFQMLSSTIQTVFIILKLTDNIIWSWWWVVSPLWIAAIIFTIVILAVIIKDTYFNNLVVVKYEKANFNDFDRKLIKKWWIGSRYKEVLIKCHICEAIKSLSNHNIDDRGIVSAEFKCNQPKCTSYNIIKLENWKPL